MALSGQFPIRPERQRSNYRNLNTSLILIALIIDITEEARNKDKGTEGGSALYGKRPDPKQTDNKDKKDSKDKKTSRRRKVCKHCKHSNAFHEPDKYFVINHKLRKAWEEKHDKKFVPYQKKKEADNRKKTAKNDDNDSDRSFADVSSVVVCLPGIKTLLQARSRFKDPHTFKMSSRPTRDEMAALAICRKFLDGIKNGIQRPCI